MPSVSKKQHNLMAAVANNPKFAKRVGIKQSVGEEFMKTDKGRKFAKGGVTRHDDEAMDKKMIKKAVGMHDKQLHGGKKTDLAALKKGGLTGGKAAHAAKEGRRVAKEMEYDYKTGKKSFAGTTAQRDAHAEKEGRKVAKAMDYDFSKGRKMELCGGGKVKKMATGGLTSGHKSADGIAVRGKTKGTAVAMKRGGKCK